MVKFYLNMIMNLNSDLQMCTFKLPKFDLISKTKANLSTYKKKENEKLDERGKSIICG